MRNDFRFGRARAYAAKFPGAVAGQSGHNQTFKLACILVKGFDLSASEAMRVMQEWNLSCEPPWSEAELDHKISDANDKPDDRERGWMLTPRRG